MQRLSIYKKDNYAYADDIQRQICGRGDAYTGI